jgi:transcriptional antiterminator RfaH
MWYVAQVKPGAWRIAERNLVRQGFVVFAPLQARTIRSRGKFRENLQLLFPGYLFVYSDYDPMFLRAVDHTHGVSHLIGFGDGPPHPLPKGFVQEIQKHVDANGVWVFRYVPNAGDSVRVTSGPFSDLIAKVESVTAQQRVWLLLETLNMGARVAVGIAEIEPEFAVVA